MFPILATTVTVEKPTTLSELLKRVENQSGLKVEVGTLDADAVVPAAGKKPFWELLESVAATTNTHLAINGASKSIAFAAGRSATAASLEGPFRISNKSITAKIDGVTGQSGYVVALDVHWEPRFPVFRMDAQPRITSAKDDLGNALRVRETSVKTAITGYSHTAEVRVEGLTRKAGAVAALAGEFTVTASPKMLAFAFDDLSTLPVTKQLDGVKATITKVLKREEVWEIQLTVEYPNPPPAFESFESWTNHNTFQLVPPNKRAGVVIVNSDITSNDRVITAAYRFSQKAVDLANRKGWSIVCESPAPLVEFSLPFRLKDLKLP
ncbi:hypothetical protein [Limnoglobus roseus]|uniref:hypothetical protein n=1 Tax=Limnoglobus roseus TaxID=2598579 RepID=UPI0011EAA743|nr:hypothetical protein [Limnoglobus roseus]